jgi:hypothetical protein
MNEHNYSDFHYTFDDLEQKIMRAVDDSEKLSCCMQLFQFWDEQLREALIADNRPAVEVPVFASAATLIRRSSDWIWPYVWAWIKDKASAADEHRLILMNSSIFEVVLEDVNWTDIDEFLNVHELIGFLLGIRDNETLLAWRTDLLVDFVENVPAIFEGYLRQVSSLLHNMISLR